MASHWKPTAVSLHVLKYRAWSAVESFLLPHTTVSIVGSHPAVLQAASPLVAVTHSSPPAQGVLVSVLPSAHFTTALRSALQLLSPT